jgi:hypothetical protein
MGPLAKVKLKPQGALCVGSHLGAMQAALKLGTAPKAKSEAQATRIEHCFGLLGQLLQAQGALCPTRHSSLRQSQQCLALHCAFAQLASSGEHVPQPERTSQGVRKPAGCAGIQQSCLG